jgi:hypothetical protein
MHQERAGHAPASPTEVETLIHGGDSLRRLDAAIKESAKMNPPLSTPDVLVHNEGTIFLFCPLTQKSKQWICEHVDENAT